MGYIIIYLIMIIIGLRGILKTKIPKFKGGARFPIETNYYLSNFLLFFVGIIFLIIKIKSYF
ncbi:hypothetical protein L1275_000882 [Flavobacterium sp. HSC-61S13]|nr:hypothetical protein [Flavobacterium sp. HSC-61S13]